MSRVYAIILCLGSFIIALDQWTKNVALEKLPREGFSIDFLSWWNWTLVHNHGAAFGLFRDLPDSFRIGFFIALPPVVLTILWFAIVRHFKAQQTLGPIAVGLIVGGAIGNLIDRVRFGYVIDFIDWFYPSSSGKCLPLFFPARGGECHWPVFNVADSAIFIAASLILIEGFLEAKKGANSEENSND